MLEFKHTMVFSLDADVKPKNISLLLKPDN